MIVIWEEDDDIAIRSAASEVAKRLVADERARIRQQVLNELGPLAFAVFDLGVGSRGAVRTGELEGESCIFQQLRAALTSSDAEVSGRAWDVLRP